MLVCVFCSACPSEKEELAQCRCLHSFCDQCANVNCPEDSNFSACSFCPICAVKCEVLSYHAGTADLADAQEKEKESQQEQQALIALQQPPNEFLCPITHELMDDPVVLADGFSYNRAAIIEWLAIRKISPLTGEPVENALMPNIVLRVMINDWRQQHNNTTAA